MWFVKGFEALPHVKSLGNYYGIFTKMISENQPADTLTGTESYVHFSDQRAVRESNYLIFKVSSCIAKKMQFNALFWYLSLRPLLLNCSKPQQLAYLVVYCRNLT